MAKIVWTESALLDLNDIVGYIALDKVAAAEKLVNKVFERVDLLTDSPASGRKPPELGKTKYTEVIVGPCRIFYRTSDGEIVILYIMRGERLLKNYILGERDSKDN